MEALREVTVWETEYQPNHTYLLDGDRIVAYIPKGTDEIRVSKSGRIKLDRRYRKFEKVDASVFGEVARPAAKTLKVEGSKGAVYEVDLEEGSCTCPGFKFRGQCKHINQLKEQKHAELV